MINLKNNEETIRNFKNSKIFFCLLVFITFLISVVLRLYWVSWANDYPYFFHNGELMISTNDGYAFAEGARDMIQGFHEPNDLSYFGSSLSSLTVFLCKILPFKFESIILYMSVFFSSLIVIPIMLISREFKYPEVGFIAAIVSSIANSYYNRTMAGYYDTDMLNIVFAVFILWALIRLLVKKDRLCLLYIPAFILMYNWWYPSSFSLNSAMLIMFLIYTLVFERKSRLNYEAIILMLVALTNIALWIQIFLILAIFVAIYFKQDRISLKKFSYIGGFVFLLFVIRGGLDPILFQLKFYIFRSVADSANVAFNFFNVNQTIMESGTIPLSIFMQRVSSSPIVFAFGILGYAFLCFRYKEFLLSLPILALGCLAFKAGLRFTIYAVPVIGFGFGYFVKMLFDFIVFFLLNSKDDEHTKQNSLKKFLKFSEYRAAFASVFFVLIAIFASFASFKHIKEYKTHPVFYASEVQALETLKKIAKREDYVISWWDYGYPIRYYSDVKTLIDGGKHLGSHNFPVSFALCNDEISSANMARLEVEYTEKAYHKKIKQSNSYLKAMMKDYNFTDINDFLISLGLKDFKAPKPTRDIYYFLPDRMLQIFNVISEFSNLDLKDGKPYNDFFYYMSEVYDQNSYGVDLGNSIMLNSDLSKVNVDGKEIDINSFYETYYDANEKLNVKEINLNDNAPLYVIFMKDYRKFLVLNKKAFDSAYIQLYVLERYDKELFEPTFLSPVAKIYKLKR